MSISGAEGEKWKLLTEWPALTKKVKRGLSRLGHDIALTEYQTDYKVATRLRKEKKCS